MSQLPCKYVGMHGLINLLNFKTTQYACVQQKKIETEGD